MRFDLLCVDWPWIFQDKLRFSTTHQCSEEQYDCLTSEVGWSTDFVSLIQSVLMPDCAMLFWFPSALIETGEPIRMVHAWGFKVVQLWPWIKTKRGLVGLEPEDLDDQSVSTGQGHYGRGGFEPAYLCTRGHAKNMVWDMSTHSVICAPKRTVKVGNQSHSAKPEEAQDKLEQIFSGACSRLELFARRVRASWTCIGNECPSSIGEDIRDSLKRLGEL